MPFSLCARHVAFVALVPFSWAVNVKLNVLSQELKLVPSRGPPLQERNSVSYYAYIHSVNSLCKKHIFLYVYLQRPSSVCKSGKGLCDWCRNSLANKCSARWIQGLPMTCGTWKVILTAKEVSSRASNVSGKKRCQTNPNNMFVGMPPVRVYPNLFECPHHYLTALQSFADRRLLQPPSRNPKDRRCKQAKEEPCNWMQQVCLQQPLQMMDGRDCFTQEIHSLSSVLQSNCSRDRVIAGFNHLLKPIENDPSSNWQIPQHRVLRYRNQPDACIRISGIMTIVICLRCTGKCLFVLTK